MSEQYGQSPPAPSPDGHSYRRPTIDESHSVIPLLSKSIDSNPNGQPLLSRAAAAPQSGPDVHVLLSFRSYYDGLPPPPAPSPDGHSYRRPTIDESHSAIPSLSTSIDRNPNGQPLLSSATATPQSIQGASNSTSQRFEEFARRDREELGIARSEGEKPVQETQADHRKAELCGTNKQLQNHGVQNTEILDLRLKREHLDPPPECKPFLSTCGDIVIDSCDGSSSLVP